jgi:hypothetical protein
MMSRQSRVSLIVGVVVVLGIVIFLHFGASGSLRHWMMALHGKHSWEWLGDGRVASRKFGTAPTIRSNHLTGEIRR